MSKTVLPTHIIGERGVNVFADYCNRHQPYILWREETKNDFGVDGEVELTEITIEGKIKPTSQILKVQIKSTQNDKSYMASENEDSFSFYASEDDIEYWKNYRQYGYQVLLVIFDGREGHDFLYCKQVTDIDAALATKKKKTKSQPILFSKTENRLIIGQNDFVTRFQSSFKNRINYSSKETLDTNMWPFRSRPPWIYTYPTHYKTKKDIFTKIAQNEAPYFVIKNSVIYTFIPIEKDFKSFFEHVVSEGKKRSEHRFQDVLESVVLRNYYVELLNEYIRDFMRKRGLFYQKEYRKYYFFLKDDQTEYKVPYRTRKIDKETEKSVVTYHQYGKDAFFRHWAIEAKPLFIEDKIFLVVSHKYLFTSDRKTPLKPEKITKYTNYLNARTFNNGVLDLLHFWWYHLSKGSHEVIVFDGTTLNQTSITIGKSINFEVKFGIPLDGEKLFKRKKNISSAPSSSIQSSLFD
ncbi:DUF4365 domain-containing protein [Cytophagaceae bacterium YF14B1]|uniref:DUF4365 domain-containing protein n=1 Tax=Xanthocytophaga flava TaxID=3048013 RepID=A0AAE3QZ65_9BACT|nr:DUF4365 domain-containing protein [Xanthocytophaga flavus]MDJ1486215.1 DUF4365 domain-containing protein [Xanthocytophaga flavus]